MPLSCLLQGCPELHAQGVCQRHWNSVANLAVLIVHISIEAEVIRESLRIPRTMVMHEHSCRGRGVEDLPCKADTSHWTLDRSVS